MGVGSGVGGGPAVTSGTGGGVFVEVEFLIETRDRAHSEAIVAALKARFPAIVGPHKEDICYATTNRQAAVKEIAGSINLLLVVG